MLKTITNLLRRLFRWIKGLFSPPQPAMTEQSVTRERDYEQKFMRLLDGVENAWESRRFIEFLNRSGYREAQWVQWLQGFRERPINSQAPNRELGRRMTLLARDLRRDLRWGNFGRVVGEVGEVLLLRKPPLPPQKVDREVSLDDRTFEDGLASCDRAMEINPNDHEAHSNRGFALYNLGRYEEALASYDRALEIKPDDHNAWFMRGFALNKLGRYEDVIASCDRALEINPNDPEVWNNRGAALFNLGRYEEAIASCDRALEINPDNHNGWFMRGVALNNLGRYDDAIVSYDPGLEIKPDDHNGWFMRGVALNKLGRYEDAIVSYNRALEIKPDDHNGWFMRGVALNNLGRYDDAIASYDCALEIKPNYPKAHYNRGAALNNLGRYDDAIASFDRALQYSENQHWESWVGKSIATYEQKFSNCEAAIPIYDQGISSIKPENIEAKAMLQKSKGEIYYRHGKIQAYTLKRDDYYWKAVKSYREALDTLTINNKLPNEQLEIILEIIRIHRALKNHTIAVQYQLLGVEIFDNTIENRPAIKQPILAKYGPLFSQFSVDHLVTKKQASKALQKADEWKNLRLLWLLEGLNANTIPLNDQQIQQLLNPETSIIYWHLSDAVLTTFIIKDKQTPSILNVSQNDQQNRVNPLNPLNPLNPENPVNPENPENPDQKYAHRQRFQEWIENWQKSYESYRKKEHNQPRDKTWENQLPQELEKLANILDIKQIISELDGIKNLILIPHRDLHLLPLEALFAIENSANALEITMMRLPSILTGIAKIEDKTPPQPNQMLCVKHPGNDPQNHLLFADVEARAICKIYDTKPLEDADATKENVTREIGKKSGYLHFSCHGIHDFINPVNSALEIERELLTLEKLLKMDLNPYYIVSLSACETGLGSKFDSNNEFVGLSSACLARGATYVISTLWTVKDISSTLIMIKFYQLLKQEPNLTPPEVLKASQKWLRELNYRDLIIWYKELLSAVKHRRCKANLNPRIKEAEKEALIKGEDHRPYRDYYHWAGFTISGKIV